MLGAWSRRLLALPDNSSSEGCTSADLATLTLTALRNDALGISGCRAEREPSLRAALKTFLSHLFQVDIVETEILVGVVGVGIRF